MDLFTDIVRDAGIPTEQEELNAAFRQLAVDERVTFNNDSSFSPFWRLVTALVTKPVLWLLGLLTNEVLPNLFLKTAKGKWVDLYVWSLDLERKRASKALGELVLHRYDDIDELEVSAGTVIQTVPISGTVYRVLVKDDAVFEAGKKTLHIIVEAEEAGTAYNVGNGLYSVVVDNGLSGLIERVSAVDWLLVPGADEETDDDLKLRGRNQFTAVNRWHIDSTYRAMISKFQGISVDDIYFQHDAPRGPGTANAYILFDADAPAGEYLEKINSYINEQDNHGFGDDLQCFVMSTYL
ncbi:MAG: baseplate J/gp47 family protein, partial [Gammaproteobacteria bacterium]|nr:baseplate J/gp47 family protein [Gammaproteobacteria bacterium]